VALTVDIGPDSRFTLRRTQSHEGRVSCCAISSAGPIRLHHASAAGVPNGLTPAEAAAASVVTNMLAAVCPRLVVGLLPLQTRRMLGQQPRSRVVASRPSREQRRSLLEDVALERKRHPRSHQREAVGVLRPIASSPRTLTRMHDGGADKPCPVEGGNSCAFPTTFVTALSSFA
jgi:hypothetical protein